MSVKLLEKELAIFKLFLQESVEHSVHVSLGIHVFQAPSGFLRLLEVLHRILVGHSAEELHSFLFPLEF
jgi:hypothetical protein